MSGASGKVYKKTELVGASTSGYDTAIQAAIERARKTLRNVEWFEVKELRGRLTGGTIEYQATVEVGFALEDAKP